MARKAVRDDLDRLCEQREELVKAKPALDQSLKRFVEDLKRYKALRQQKGRMEKSTQSSRERMIFGGRFQDS